MSVMSTPSQSTTQVRRKSEHESGGRRAFMGEALDGDGSRKRTHQKAGKLMHPARLPILKEENCLPIVTSSKVHLVISL